MTQLFPDNSLAILLLLSITAVLTLSGDTRSQCQNKAREEERVCEAVADDKLQKRLAIVEMKDQKCRNPFVNPDWIACRDAASTTCGADTDCLAREFKICQDNALAACDTEKREATEQWLQENKDEKRICIGDLSAALLNCPPPGLCMTDSDCQDTNPGTVCTDGRCARPQITCGLINLVCSNGNPDCDLTTGQWFCPWGTACYLPVPPPCYTGATMYCSSDQGGWICIGSPIIIDVQGKGFHLTDIKHGVPFRMKPDSTMMRISWTDSSGGNAFLVLDRNGNGTIDDATELFGDATPQPATEHRNGFNALSVFDLPANGGNGNGMIDPGDSVFDHLRVWVDSNHNGISEPNELFTLRAAGIFAISLHYTPNAYKDQYGNQFRYQSWILDKVASKHPLCYDVFLQMVPFGH